MLRIDSLQLFRGFRRPIQGSELKAWISRQLSSAMSWGVGDLYTLIMALRVPVNTETYSFPCGKISNNVLCACKVRPNFVITPATFRHRLFLVRHTLVMSSTIRRTLSIDGSNFARLRSSALGVFFRKPSHFSLSLADSMWMISVIGLLSVEIKLAH